MPPLRSSEADDGCVGGLSVPGRKEIFLAARRHKGRKMRGDAQD
jgi:hypothetical protein